MLNRRVGLHTIDATPARWRGDAGSSPLDRARSAASSPRNDLVKNCRVHPTHCLIPQVVSCPPFDRQYAAAGGLSELYGASFSEMRRVLRPDGRAALLLDEKSLEVAQRHWKGLCVLGPMPLGPWVRTVLCAWPGGDAWAAWDRSAWARRRDADLPGLEPVWLL